MNDLFLYLVSSTFSEKAKNTNDLFLYVVLIAFLVYLTWYSLGTLLALYGVVGEKHVMTMPLVYSISKFGEPSSLILLTLYPFALILAIAVLVIRDIINVTLFVFALMAFLAYLLCQFIMNVTLLGRTSSMSAFLWSIRRRHTDVLPEAFENIQIQNESIKNELNQLKQSYRDLKRASDWQNHLLNQGIQNNYSGKRLTEYITANAKMVPDNETMFAITGDVFYSPKKKQKSQHQQTPTQNKQHLTHHQNGRDIIITQHNDVPGDYYHFDSKTGVNPYGVHFNQATQQSN